MTCKACKEREAKEDWREWAASEPQCAFPESGAFTPRNWNCATANLLRDAVGEGRETTPRLVARQYLECGDQTSVTVDVSETDIEMGEEGESALILWLTWYKRRGRTEEAWLLGEGCEPRRPTEAECLEIIARISKLMGRK